MDIKEDGDGGHETASEHRQRRKRGSGGWVVAGARRLCSSKQWEVKVRVMIPGIKGLDSLPLRRVEVVQGPFTEGGGGVGVMAVGEEVGAATIGRLAGVIGGEG